MPKFHFFRIYDHVAYQIKGNDACSNRVANILPTGIPLTPGWGQNSFSERSYVAYQIKGNGGKANILSLHTPSTPGMCSKGQIIFCEINFVCFVCLI